jgi:hypothetical protein
MSKYVSEKFKIFATGLKGEAVSFRGGATIEEAREAFRKARDSGEYARIRVRHDTYNLGGGGRVYEWLCDWKKG